MEGDPKIHSALRAGELGLLRKCLSHAVKAALTVPTRLGRHAAYEKLSRPDSAKPQYAAWER